MSSKPRHQHPTPDARTSRSSSPAVMSGGWQCEAPVSINSQLLLVYWNSVRGTRLSLKSKYMFVEQTSFKKEIVEAAWVRKCVEYPRALGFLNSVENLHSGFAVWEISAYIPTFVNFNNSNHRQTRKITWLKTSPVLPSFTQIHFDISPCLGSAQHVDITLEQAHFRSHFLQNFSSWVLDEYMMHVLLTGSLSEVYYYVYTYIYYRILLNFHMQFFPFLAGSSQKSPFETVRKSLSGLR